MSNIFLAIKIEEQKMKNSASVSAYRMKITTACRRFPGAWGAAAWRAFALVGWLLAGTWLEAQSIAVKPDASGNLVLHWTGVTGKHYRVESSSNLLNRVRSPADLLGSDTDLGTVVRANDILDNRGFWRVATYDVNAIMAPASVGLFNNTMASVLPQTGVSYEWAITGGDFLEQNGTSTIRFAASTPGVVTLTCVLTRSGLIVASNSCQVTVINSLVKPLIITPGYVTAGQGGITASVENQPGAAAAWSLAGGVITAGATNNHVTYTAGSAGSLTLQCTVTRGGISATADPVTVHVLATNAGAWNTPLAESSLPPLQINLSGGGEEWAFANMLRSAEAWIYRDGDSAAGAQSLASTVQLDAGGWPTQFPTNTHMSIFAGYQTGATNWLHGVFVLTWQGAGNVGLESSRNDGQNEVVLLNDQAHGRFIRVIKDPSKSAPIVFIHSSNATNPVRNLRLWAPAYDGAGLDLTTSSNLAPGQVAGSLEPLPGQPEPMWHPRFLQHLNEVTNYGAIRFMGWENINLVNWDRDTLEWSDRADPAYCFNTFSTIDSSYNRYPLAAYRQSLGLPFEWMIDACNAAGKDLWIQVPHIASPDLIRRLADLCATRLNPNLRVWFEFSNEIWNYSGCYIPQGNQARIAAAVHYGIPLSSVDTIGSQHAWGSGHIQGLALKTFEDEWRAAGQPDNRLINVVASFVASSAFSSQVLAAAKEVDPNLPEVLAVTDYFGYGTQFDIFALHDFGTNAGVWPESLFEGTAAIVRRNLYATADTWKASADVAHAAGVPLVAYEGGQHMLPMGLGDWNNPAHVDFMTFMYAFQRSPQIHDLYLEHYALWNAMGGRTASLFTDISTMSFWGYWGAKEYVTQTRTNCAKWDAFGTWADLETGVRAMSDPIGTRPVLPNLNLVGEARLPFSQDITATNGDGTVQIQVVGGSLPPGLALTPLGSGVVRLAGTPATNGVYRFVLRALDADKDPDFHAYTFSVDPQGVSSNALVLFRGLDTPATLPNNGWIGRYDSARPETQIRNASNVVIRTYLPFSMADGQAIFNRENLEVAGTPKVIPASSPLNMYGGWSVTSLAANNPLKVPSLSDFTGLRNYQWSSWVGDPSGNPTAFDVLLLWRTNQFNPLGGGSYSFGTDATTALLRVDITALIDDGDNELRFVVLDGGTYYLSEAAYTSPYLGDGYFQLANFSGNATPGQRWAVFSPTADNYAIPATNTLTFVPHTFANVQAVGLAYHGYRWGYNYSFNFSRFLALGRRQ